MKITVLTLFPEMVKCFTSESILKRAQEKGILEVRVKNLSDWGRGKWKKVDDTPYGGGAGMVFRVDVVVGAIKELKHKNKKAKVILLTPQGEKYDQKRVQMLSQEEELILVCGHYEGFDERIRDYVDMEISIGDYVLTGGEIAAAVIVDSVARLLPGVLGKEESHQDDSFSEGLLEYPHYTRPEEYEGKKVPEVLRGGNHKEIAKWRKEKSEVRTNERRPDLT
ncbi:MAG: tRNA (guanosine(37)-N1)-methyltransferase TrmD [Patescibacteria group bacterium]|nr:tRNA (guanosine(37)-N1)-methyltransferase TrmD [Patescibacteria group bacterium]